MLPIYNDTYSPQIPESTVSQIFDSIVRIKIGKTKGTGFFLQIKIRDRELNCLVTNEHIISQLDVILEETIYLYYGKKDNEIMKRIKLDKNERFIRCYFKPKDVTIIEIKNYDYIPNYKFLQPDLRYKSGYYQYLYQKYYLAGYPKVDDFCHQDERHISSGLITKIGNNYFEFEHSLDRRVGSSGSPICLLSNGKVVGIHKANRYEKYYGNYSINIATFIGIIIDGLDDEYYLLPKINNFCDFNYGFYEQPKNKVLSHSKTQNFIDFNSIFLKSSMDSPIAKINPVSTPKTNIFDGLFKDKSSSNFESKSVMNMMLLNLNFGFSGKKSTNEYNISLLSCNDKYHVSVKKEKKSTNNRSKTPLNFNFSLDYNSLTKKQGNYNNDNEYTLTRSSIRITNKSYEPKRKRKKRAKKKNLNNISNIVPTYNNMNNSKSSYLKIKNEEINNYSYISNNNLKSNYCEINYKKESFKAKIGTSRNFYSYTSKSVDSITLDIKNKNRKTNLEFQTTQNYYWDNGSNYGNNYIYYL